MANIPGLRSIIEYVGQFITWTYNVFRDPVSGSLSNGPILTFVNAILDNTVLFIFVVAVPLVGLGIGLLNRLIKSN